jgi:hypothetical protein
MATCSLCDGEFDHSEESCECLSCRFSVCPECTDLLWPLQRPDVCPVCDNVRGIRGKTDRDILAYYRKLVSR